MRDELLRICRRGTVKKIIEVALPRPRDSAAPEFANVLRELTARVQEEQRRHEKDEAAI